MAASSLERPAPAPPRKKGNAIEIQALCRQRFYRHFFYGGIDTSLIRRLTEGARNVESRTPSVPIRAGHPRPLKQTAPGAIHAPRHFQLGILPKLSISFSIAAKCWLRCDAFFILFRQEDACP